MATITVNKDESKEFSAYATAKQVIDQLDGAKPEGNQIHIELSGFNRPEAYAVFSLLRTAYIFGNEDHIQGNVNNADEGNAHTDILTMVLGVGELTHKWNVSTVSPYKQTANITMEVPRHGMPPASEFQRLLDDQINILHELKQSSTGEDNFIICPDENSRTLQMPFLEALVQSHGWGREEKDIAEVEIDQGWKKSPGIRIKPRVLDYLIEKEITANTPSKTNPTPKKRMPQSNVITVNKPTDKPFQAFKTVTDILTQYKTASMDKGFLLKLKGLNEAETKAITVLLTHALVHAANDKLKGNVEVNDKPENGTLTYVMPGIGSVVSKYNKDSHNGMVSFPAVPGEPLPIHSMKQVIGNNKFILTQSMRFPCTVGGANYQAIICENDNAVNQQFPPIASVIKAHGHTDDNDVGRNPEPLNTPMGKRPAILIRQEVFDDVIKKEGLGKGQQR